MPIALLSFFMWWIVPSFSMVSPISLRKIVVVLSNEPIQAGSTNKSSQEIWQIATCVVTKQSSSKTIFQLRPPYLGWECLSRPSRILPHFQRHSSLAGYSSDPWNLQKNATMSCTVDSFLYTVQCTSICDLRLCGHDLQQPCWSILICRMEKRSLRSISGGQQVKSGIGALISRFKFSDFVAQLSGSLVTSALPSLKAKAPGKATWNWLGVFFLQSNHHGRH